MSNNYYQIYINKVLQLAQTIVIKSTDTAEALNQYVTDYYGAAAVDWLRPETWKYYLNISGEYHITDTPMMVVSMDTLETIIFSKENLLLHRTTARNYVFGTRQYNELVAQYPQQEMLILGILYPVDMAAAIAAPDGKILSYPADLVEDNEYSLISKLQTWIDGYKVRWVNSQFAISDELYSATALGIMYLNLVPAILNFRLAACKTNEAHSYHVRQYLASHGALDVYMDQMTLKQALFFYRNIAYIERNTGQKNIFSWLVEHIMSERGIPLAEYVMRHDISQLPNNVYPTVAFRKNPLNLDLTEQANTSLTLVEILNKEATLARDNEDYNKNYLSTIQEVLENSPLNVLPTKALDSSMIDYTDSSPYNLPDLLMAHWLFWSANGVYTTFISVTNPKTGEQIPISVKDAYTLMWYAFCASIGIDLVTVPKVVALRAQRLPLPTVDDLMSIVDARLIDRQIAVDVLSVQPPISQLISTEAFYNKVLDVYKASEIQRGFRALQEHQLRRGMVSAMIARIYADDVVTLEPEGTLYQSWFSQRNIKISDFTQTDLTALYLSLVKDATGMALVTTNSIQNLQATMVKMLKQLSSYSVQFMRYINASNIKTSDWGAIRAGDLNSALQGHLFAGGEVVGVQSSQVHWSESESYDVNSAVVKSLSYSTGAHQERLEIDVKVGKGALSSISILPVPEATVRVGFITPIPNNDLNKIIPVPGIDIYIGLTYPQQQTLRDIYNTNLIPVAPKVSLPDIVQDTDLDGLDYPPS